MANPILVTGAAGFIGFHLTQRLLADGHSVVGLDNINSYYSPKLKQARLSILARHKKFQFVELDLAHAELIADLFAQYQFAYVLHLAGQPGVRYSIENPQAYAQSNLLGFLNVLEGCRRVGSNHLLYASSSSVYGANTSVPWQANKIADHPLSLYGATKRADELMAHAYAHLFGIPMTGLRFFTVYGPWGRPDMAYWGFTDAILRGRSIKLFNNGNMRRDFTYIDDAIEAITRLIIRPAKPDPDWLSDAPNPASSSAPWRIYNIGNSQPIALMDFVRVIEKAVGRPASCEFLPMQPGDVVETSADCADLERAIGFKPQTPIDSGISRFVDWFRSFHELS